MINRGDLWTSGGILKLARFYAMLRLCVLPTSNTMALLKWTGWFFVTPPSVIERRTGRTMKFFTIPGPIYPQVNFIRFNVITRRSNPQLLIEAKAIHSGSAPLQVQPINPQLNLFRHVQKRYCSVSSQRTFQFFNWHSFWRPTGQPPASTANIRIHDGIHVIQETVSSEHFGVRVPCLLLRLWFNDMIDDRWSSIRNPCSLTSHRCWLFVLVIEKLDNFDFSRASPGRSDRKILEVNFFFFRPVGRPGPS